MSDKDKNNFKIATIGESEVGKTCIIRRYVENSFTTRHLATIGVDYLRKTITIDNRVINLQIFDTAGQERFRNITSQYFKNADGILLVFDVTSKTSFNKIELWMKEIEKIISIDEVAIVLIGNKVDQTNKREVTYEMGKEIADKYQLNYFETSAQSGVNVEESLNCLTQIIMKQKNINNGESKSDNHKMLIEGKSNSKSTCCKSE